MNRFNDLLFQGMETILTGLVMPIILGTFASLIQVAIYGWQGFKKYCANFSMSIFMGILTHWILLEYDMSGQIKASIISASALISSDVLKFFVSKRFVNILLTMAGNRLRCMISRWLGIPINFEMPKEETGSDKPKNAEAESAAEQK